MCVCLPFLLAGLFVTPLNVGSSVLERSLMQYENVPNGLSKFEQFTQAYQADTTVL
jgi:hypothetical protein